MRIFRLIPALTILLGTGLLLPDLPARSASNPANVPHLHVQLVVPSSTIGLPGQPTPAGLYFKLESGWHVYWKNAGEAGEPPRIKWMLPQGLTVTDLQFPVPQRLPMGPLMDYGYENEVMFPFTISADPGASAGTATLHAHVTWLVCREVCLPGKTDLEITRSVGGSGGTVTQDAELYKRLANTLPQPLPATDKAGYTLTPAGYKLTVETGQRETAAEFFPADPDIIANAAPQKVTPTAKGLTIELAKDPNATATPTELRGLIKLQGGRAYEIAVRKGTPVAIATAPSAVPDSAPIRTASADSAGPAQASNSAVPSPSTGLLRIVALAFLGGIILNLMPCVFPVLFLKGLALVNSGNQQRRQLRAHGLVYTAGILVSFWALVAVLLALRSAGAHLGWGFQFQSPIFLFLMAGLLFFLGLSLAGQFEFGLSLTSAGGSLAQKHGFTGSFFTGVLAVIVATPCTAPLMGAAIGYALAQPAAVTFAVFTALALGLAAPYLALTLQPAWTRVLPRPGAWMDILRQAVSIPIFGTVIWLAWVVAQAYGATMLASVLAAFLLLAIAGWFLGRWPGKGWAAVVAGMFVLSVVGLGIYSGRILAATPASNQLSNQVSGQAVIVRAGEWQPWSPEAVKRYHDAGRPVFVDFTASWCLSCQVNERVAISKPEVQKAFLDKNVALLKADWTQHDEKIAQALEKLGRSGVPAYALYPPGETGPTLLPEALTPGIVTDALQQLPGGPRRQTTAQFVRR
jgi:thiol:disulfide interchange protein